MPRRWLILSTSRAVTTVFAPTSSARPSPSPSPSVSPAPTDGASTTTVTEEGLRDRVHPRWRAHRPTFRAAPCPFDPEVAYDPEIISCGYVLVPEDRRNPDSRLIRLSLMRVAPLEGGEGRPVVRLAGGPGGPGV